jgi:methylated-DNA-[protein]-cysteine S-methyltransferase
MTTPEEWMIESLKFHVCETERGWMGVVFSEHGLRYTTLPLPTRDEALRRAMELGALEPMPEKELADVPERVCALASGRYENLALHIDWNGIGGFRRRVMELALSIPHGETRTYRWLAEQAGSPRAARAAGRVMATNPLPIVVPCHRVIGSDGGLLGYGPGMLRMKEALLRAEGAW